MRVRASLALALLLAGGSAVAQESTAPAESRWYAGLRGGASWHARDDQAYLRDLIARGHQVQIIAVDTEDVGGTLYAGYRFDRNASIELGYVQLGQFDSAVYAPTSDPRQLALDAAELQPDAGDAVALSLRVDIPLWQRLKLHARIGGFYWWQSVDVSIGNERVKADRDNLGLTVGGGASVALSRHWSLGAGGDLYRTSSREPVRQLYAQVEYRF